MNGKNTEKIYRYTNNKWFQKTRLKLIHSKTKFNKIVQTMKNVFSLLKKSFTDRENDYKPNFYSGIINL